MKLTILIPAYNEASTILETIQKCHATVIKNINNVDKEIEKEIIIINDGSTDEILKKINSFEKKNIKMISHDANYGKGRALQSGLALATGDFTIIQDADLEYDPKEYQKLVNEILKNNEKKAVYGNRSYRHGYLIYRVGAFLLTTCINILYGTRLTDSYTCYKLISTDLFRLLALTSDGFEIEAEITTKLLNRNIQIIEIPIDYSPRTFKNGKKIRGRDAWRGLQTTFHVWKKKL